MYHGNHLSAQSTRQKAKWKKVNSIRRDTTAVDCCVQLHIVTQIGQWTRVSLETNGLQLGYFYNAVGQWKVDEYKSRWKLGNCKLANVFSAYLLLTSCCWFLVYSVLVKETRLRNCVSRDKSSLLLNGKQVLTALYRLIYSRLAINYL